MYWVFFYFNNPSQLQSGTNTLVLDTTYPCHLIAALPDNLLTHWCNLVSGLSALHWHSRSGESTLWGGCLPPHLSTVRNAAILKAWSEFYLRSHWKQWASSSISSLNVDFPCRSQDCDFLKECWFLEFSNRLQLWEKLLARCLKGILIKIFTFESLWELDPHKYFQISG